MPAPITRIPPTKGTGQTSYQNRLAVLEAKITKLLNKVDELRVVSNGRP